MDTNAHGGVADHPADSDPLITPSLFWVLLTTLSALFVIVVAVAMT